MKQLCHYYSVLFQEHKLARCQFNCTKLSAGLLPLIETNKNVIKCFSLSHQIIRCFPLSCDISGGNDSFQVQRNQCEQFGYAQVTYDVTIVLLKDSCLPCTVTWWQTCSSVIPRQAFLKHTASETWMERWRGTSKNTKYIPTCLR